MARKKPVSLIEVFKVMAKHDFNVKEASQELQINKSRIYNMKSKNKDKWEEMLKMLNRPEKKEENDVIKQEALVKVSSKKFKPVPSVRSALAEKHVGVTRRISGDESSHPAQDLVPKKSPLSKDLYAENIELNKKIKTLTDYNEELAGAVKRSNEAKEEIAKEHNNLIDDYNEMKDQYKEMQKIAAVKPLEVEETVYAVKLGKVFVTHDLRLYGHHSAAQFKDIENAQSISNEVGGTLYKSVLMPVEGD